MREKLISLTISSHRPSLFSINLPFHLYRLQKYFQTLSREGLLSIFVTGLWLVWLFKWIFLLRVNSSTHFDGIPERCYMVTTVFSLAFLQISCTQNRLQQFGVFSSFLLSNVVVNSKLNHISLACCIKCICQNKLYCLV